MDWPWPSAAFLPIVTILWISVAWHRYILLKQAPRAFIPEFYFKLTSGPLSPKERFDAFSGKSSHAAIILALLDVSKTHTLTL